MPLLRLALLFVFAFTLLFFASTFMGRALHGEVVAYIEWDTFTTYVARLDLRTGLSERFFPLKGDEYVVDYAWSPNGQYMAVLLNSDYQDRIAVLDLMGAEIAEINNPYALLEEVAWFPDSETLLFTVYTNKQRVYAAHIAAPHTWDLVLDARADDLSYWAIEVSPDGTQLAYSLDLSYLVIANIDGTNEQRLRDSGSLSSWSPDGQALLYAEYDGDDQLLYTMNWRTGDYRPLTSPPLYGFEATWSSDGQRIVFISYGEDAVYHDYEVFVVNVDGSGLRQLTFNDVDDELPQWMP